MISSDEMIRRYYELIETLVDTRWDDVGDPARIRLVREIEDIRERLRSDAPSLDPQEFKF